MDVFVDNFKSLGQHNFDFNSQALICGTKGCYKSIHVKCLMKLELNNSVDQFKEEF